MVPLSGHTPCQPSSRRGPMPASSSMSTCRWRVKLAERVIADGLEVGGGHLPAPGFARVERAGTVYRIVPSDVFYI